jgi:hypothetical protein
MHNTYIKPSLTTYSRQEIMDLIGPVKTQYPPPPPPPPAICSCESPVHAPVWKEFNVAPLPVSVDIGGCPAFNRAEIAISSGGQLVSIYPFDRTDGAEIGNRWLVTINNFMLEGAPGQVFDVAITLYAEQGIPGQVCQSTITLQGL